MRIGLADLDVFAYIDADSAEAKAFTTYLGYVRAFDDLMTNASGILDFAHIRKQMDPAGLHRLRSRPVPQQCTGRLKSANQRVAPRVAPPSRR